VSAVEPARLLRAAQARGALDRLRSSGVGPNLHVVAAGKAAWLAAHAFAELVPGAINKGLIAGPRAGATPPFPPFEWYDAGHPLPNPASVAAGARAMTFARESRADSWLVVLLSGGASAMLTTPAAGITLEDKVVTARALLRAGVPIDGLNCVRKHLSDVKGGRLGAAASRSLTLAISDVHGPIADDPSVIGSGPTVADPTTFADALEVVRGVDGVSAEVRGHLERGANGEVAETIKPGDPRLARAFYEVIGNRNTALLGAAREAEALGYTVGVLEEPTDGEAREAARAFVARARRIGAGGARPLCILAAGETTVTVKGDGRGGRNQEFALATTPLVGSLGRAAVLASAGTDGVDGPTDAAGALVDSSTLERSQRSGVDWQSSLADNDAYYFFEPLGDLIIWGPTGTNVADVHVLLLG
jgi:glycerate 2-kinase